MVPILSGTAFILLGLGFAALEADACSGTLGEVQNVVLDVSNRLISVTYDPPVGYENCSPLLYEVKYRRSDNMVTLKKVLTRYSQNDPTFDYWQARVLCKDVDVLVTPIFNGTRGKTYQSTVYTGNFDEYQIDMGPVREIFLQLPIPVVLYSSWIPPLDYETCPLYYNVQVKKMDQFVTSTATMDLFWELDVSNGDFDIDHFYCYNTTVTVEPFFKGISGGATSITSNDFRPPMGC